MFGLFPKTSFVSAGGRGTMPICEWVMPAPVVLAARRTSVRRGAVDCNTPKLLNIAGQCFLGLPSGRYSSS